MKIPEIKRLVTTYTLDALEKAELALIQEEAMPFEVHGEDDGEVLTHILAAKWILEDMESNGRELKESLRAYSQKVRNSIS
ncbi:MAG TPA: hypothetical protein DEO99_06650 [Bacteroidetes bacterium]|nr:hypothetical protein [Bacteroidota bacterium]MEC8032116.1 hypothetical protein [Bacteroidota bacterium]MEC8756692.1 hypothetical protein [Bacteroidota bacterium]MEC8835739.1 hypothetical protein [Bacteroidota bacterium]HCE85817.1 hypothetical protein [Bacteroidota bacterium]